MFNGLIYQLCAVVQGLLSSGMRNIISVMAGKTRAEERYQFIMRNKLDEQKA